MAALLQPLRVGHLSPRRQPAHPGTVRALGKVDGNAKFARCDGKPVDMVLVLVGDDDGVEGLRFLVGQRMRRNNSRQLSPASTRMRVLPPEITVLLPFDPEASTVKRTIHSSIARWRADCARAGLTGWEPARVSSLQKEPSVDREVHDTAGQEASATVS